MNKNLVCERAVQLIAKYEGYHSEAYICPAGIWTIGYGRTGGIKQGDESTEEFEKKWLKDRVASDLEWLLAKAPHLEEAHCVALLSFVYNLGRGALEGSTLWKKAQGKLHRQAYMEFFKWVFAGKKKLPGLVKRREEEAAIYCGAQYLPGLEVVSEAEPELPVASEPPKRRIIEEDISEPVVQPKPKAPASGNKVKSKP